MGSMTCKHCGKELPTGSTGEACSLCSIGLIPSAPQQTTESADNFQSSHAVQGRTLSGVHCPGCHAEFSLADINNCHCSICGAQFSEDRMDQLVNRVRIEARQMPEMAVKPTEIGHQAWPDDAPIW